MPVRWRAPSRTYARRKPTMSEHHRCLACHKRATPGGGQRSTTVIKGNGQSTSKWQFTCWYALSAGGARWNRTTDLSIIRVGQRAGQAIGIPSELPVRDTRSHHETVRAISFGHALGTGPVRGLGRHVGQSTPAGGVCPGGCAARRRAPSPCMSVCLYTDMHAND
jgi:hypothetical protein